MKTIDALRVTLTAFPIEYARGRAAEGALEAFASPHDLLASLAPSSGATHAARDAITLALRRRALAPIEERFPSSSAA